MKLAVDGVAVEVPSGASVLDAIHAAGGSVASLCWDERLAPHGSCRTCLVSVDGGRPVPSCTTPAHEGAAVTTAGGEVDGAVRSVLELIASELPPSALERDSELAAACEVHAIDAGHFVGARHHRGTDGSHPYVKLDRDLCIACARCVRYCDEVQGTFALSLVGRGFATVVAPGTGDWAASACVSCGGCVDTCPTGALSEPGDALAADATVSTTCGYCGVGCGLDVHVAAGGVARVTPTRAAPVNRGHACVKGRFAHGFTSSRDRLTTPLVRRDGELREAGWDEALAFVAERMLAVRAEHGPDAIAAISSARATNEENYLVQKLMRVAIGTNNVDNCSRICHAPSAAGLTASFGLSGGTHASDDLDRAECFLLAGANPTDAHPVVGARIKQRVLDGAGLIVIDPRRIELADYADLHLAPRPGTNVAVFNGIAHVLLDEGLADRDFLARRAEGLDELEALVADYDPSSVEAISGVPAGHLREAALRYAAQRPASIVYGLGITEHLHGTDGVRGLANLAILTGNVGSREGGGVNPLRGQNNVQGASDVGALPDLLPGYQPLADDAARARFEAAWGVEIGAARGLRVTELFGAALAGDVKVLWIVGEDIAQTDPDTTRVEAALDACELVVVQDLFLSRTAQRADVVFPAASFLEKDGTFVNFDRRFQRVRPAVAPPEGARSDFEIVHALARALGTDLGCPTPAAACDELAALSPLYAGISHERLDREGALHWPCVSPQDPGSDVLHLASFATPSGRARLASAPYLPPGEQPDGEYPVLLVTVRRLEHYNAGTMTRRTDNLVLRGHELLELNPADALALGLTDGQFATVTSRRGSVTLAAHPSDRVAPGQAFTSFHFPEALANVLTSDSTDVATGCPEYKVTAVRVVPA